MRLAIKQTSRQTVQFRDFRRLVPPAKYARNFSFNPARKRTYVAIINLFELPRVASRRPFLVRS